jgi:hypothetical protein
MHFQRCLIASAWLAATALLATGARADDAASRDEDVPRVVASAPELRPPAGPRVDAPTPTEEEKEQMGGEYRRVNGHNFITPSIVDSAFTNTTVSFAQGFGVYDFAAGNASGRLFLYGQRLGGLIGIVNRVGIELAATGVAAVGGDVDTILNLGAIAQLRAGGMPKVRIVTVEPAGLQITLGAGAYYNRSLRMSPGELLNQAASGQKPQILQQTEHLEISPALMIAEGIGPFGAQIAVRPDLRAAGDDSVPHRLNTGGQLEFDFDEISPVPVALAGEYVLGYAFEEGSDLDHTLVGGLYYSGRRDFLLGGSFSASPSSAATLLSGQMVMQYFF